MAVELNGSDSSNCRAEVEVVLAQPLVEHAEAAADGCFAVAEKVIGEADARLEEVLGGEQSPWGHRSRDRRSSPSFCEFAAVTLP